MDGSMLVDGWGTIRIGRLFSPLHPFSSCHAQGDAGSRQRAWLLLSLSSWSCLAGAEKHWWLWVVHAGTSVWVSGLYETSFGLKR